MKETTEKTKKQPMKWQKTFANHNLEGSISDKINNSVIRGQKLNYWAINLNNYFS